MSTLYSRVNWKDWESTDTPLDAENLNIMDAGIEKVATAVEAANTKMENHQTVYEKLLARVVTLESNLTATNKNVSSLSTDLATLHTNVDPLAGIQIKRGTVTKTFEKAADSVQLFTISELRTMFGVSESVAGFTNFGIIVSNGDGSANGVHVDGITFMGSTYYAVFDTTTASRIRLNYTIIFIPQT